MFWVCVRTVLQRDHELARDVRAVEIARQQPKDVQLAFAEWLDQRLVARGDRGSGRIEGGQQPADVVRRDLGSSRPPAGGPPSAGPHRRRCGRSPPARPASGRVRATPVRQPCRPAACRASAWSTRISIRLPSRVPSSAASSRRSRNGSTSRREATAPSCAGPGKQGPGEGDVLELAQVGEVVVDRQAPLPRPGEGFARSALARSRPAPAPRRWAARPGRSRRGSGARPRRAGRAPDRDRPSA